MKITRIRISNFRAIKNLEITNLADTVVIAGPNGSGKSCVFDAIRLLKSAYGGYDVNEIHQWFSEFQIDLNRLDEELPRLLNDQQRPMVIEADFRLATEEVEYLTSQIDTVSESLARRIVSRDREGDSTYRQFSVLANHFERPEIEAKKIEIINAIQIEISKHEVFTGRLEFSKKGQSWAESMVLMACFSTFSPEHLGIIEYHSATRNYAREQIGGLQLNIRDQHENRRQNSLYNTSSRYSNIKSEMASAYVREILAREAGVELGQQSTIVASLKEMFTDFFDGKVSCSPKIGQ